MSWIIYIDMPSCVDSSDVMPVNNGKAASFCSALEIRSHYHDVKTNSRLGITARVAAIPAHVRLHQVSFGSIWPQDHVIPCQTIAIIIRCNHFALKRAELVEYCKITP
jgi:hypothetical protein